MNAGGLIGETFLAVRQSQLCAKETDWRVPLSLFSPPQLFCLALSFPSACATVITIMPPRFICPRGCAAPPDADKSPHINVAGRNAPNARTPREECCCGFVGRSG